MLEHMQHLEEQQQFLAELLAGIGRCCWQGKVLRCDSLLHSSTLACDVDSLHAVHYVDQYEHR